MGSIRRSIGLAVLLAASLLLVACSSPQHPRVTVHSARSYVSGRVGGPPPGAPAAGDILTTDGGSWSGSPILTYLWEDCNSGGTGCIAAAGSPTNTNRYAIVSGDIGSTVEVRVTATYAGGRSSIAQSTPTGIVSASACTYTVFSMATLTSDVASAPGGSIVCIAPGSYSGMELSGSHSSMVTVEPEPNLDPNGSGKVTIALSGTLNDGSSGLVSTRIDASASSITIHNLYFTGEVSLSAGASNITIDHNDFTEQGCSGPGTNCPVGGGEMINFNAENYLSNDAPNFGGTTNTGPLTNIVISGNNFHDNNQSVTGGDDVIHTNVFSNLTITHNEFSNIVENNAGGHVDCWQNVYGGSNFTYSYNYEHDNECQGFFIKDGDVTGTNTITENLSTRDNVSATNGGSSASFAQTWDVGGETVSNNTIVDAKGWTPKCLPTNGWPSVSITCTLVLSKNVLANLNDGGGGDTSQYTISEPGSPAIGYNIIQSTFANYWTPAATDSINNPNPGFVCATSGAGGTNICGNGTLAGDDYELATNPNGIGVNWNPVSQQYGPA